MLQVLFLINPFVVVSISGNLDRKWAATVGGRIQKSFMSKQLAKIFGVPLRFIANDDDANNNNNIRSNCRRQDVALMIIYNTFL